MTKAKPALYWAVVVEGEIAGLFQHRAAARKQARKAQGRVARVKISEIASRH